MATLKTASWNIYFSHEFVKKSSAGNLYIPSTQRPRAERTADYIATIDPHVLGIIECMPPNELAHYRDEFLPGYETLTEGTGARLNIGMLYWPDSVDVEKVPFSRNKWKDQLYHNRPERIYKWTRVPLIVKVTERGSGKQFIVAVVHPKSKKTYGSNPAAEALTNRERIVAEGRRIHSILWKKHKSLGAPYDRFIIMGDINDGPWFDTYETKLLRSGVESHIGSVYEPDKVLHSSIDISDEKGTPTTPFGGGKQLDHILYTHELAHGTGNPKVVAGSGRIRNDLVNFSTGSGKSKDSDHCPVEIEVRA